MNNIFSFSRFALLFKRQWVENRALFLMTSLILPGLLVVYYFFNISWTNGEMADCLNRFIPYALFVYFGGSIFTNYVFKDLSDKNSSTTFLMVPASHFEKFMTGLLYAFVIFPVFFTLVFWAIDTFFVNYTNGIIAQIKGNTLPKNENMWVYSKKILQGPALKIIAWYIFQSYVVLGTLTYTSWSYVKTGFTAFVLFLVVYALFSVLDSLFLFSLKKQMEGLYSKQASDTREAFGNSFLFIANYLMLPFLLLVSYLKLKEKQV